MIRDSDIIRLRPPPEPIRDVVYTDANRPDIMKALDADVVRVRSLLGDADGQFLELLLNTDQGEESMQAKASAPIWFTVQQVLLKRGLGVSSISMGGELVPRPVWTNAPLKKGGSSWHWLVANYSFADLDAQDDARVDATTVELPEGAIACAATDGMFLYPEEWVRINGSKVDRPWGSISKNTPPFGIVYTLSPKDENQLSMDDVDILDFDDIDMYDSYGGGGAMAE